MGKTVGMIVARSAGGKAVVPPLRRPNSGPRPVSRAMSSAAAYRREPIAYWNACADSYLDSSRQVSGYYHRHNLNFVIQKPTN